jgi:ABC-type glycerol-3-phosphate transport system permease component
LVFLLLFVFLIMLVPHILLLLSSSSSSLSIYNCNWVDTQWQQYSSLHIYTQNNTMRQNTQNGTYITIRIL